MTTEEKILAILEKHGNTLETLQRDLQDVKHVEERIAQRQDAHGKLLTNVATDLATVLSEQQQQRTDMRYFHDDLDRMEGKIDKVASDVKNNRERIENLEETTKTPNPHKN